MKTSTMSVLKRSLLASATLLLTIAGAQHAYSQSATVNVTATVANALVLNVTNMSFGTLVLIGDDTAATASVALSTGGDLTPTSTAPAYASVFDTAGKSPGVIAISTGAPNATVNATINSVVHPILDANALVLGNFTSSLDGGLTEAAQVVGTSFPVALSGTGAATLNIGASVTTGSFDGPYPNGTYAGSFNVTFSY